MTGISCSKEPSAVKQNEELIKKTSIFNGSIGDYDSNGDFIDISESEFENYLANIYDESSVTNLVHSVESSTDNGVTQYWISSVVNGVSIATPVNVGGNGPLYAIAGGGSCKCESSECDTGCTASYVGSECTCSFCFDECKKTSVATLEPEAADFFF